jgi:hypothetical protein
MLLNWLFADAAPFSIEVFVAATAAERLAIIGRRLRQFASAFRVPAMVPLSGFFKLHHGSLLTPG